jgi:Protein of unknown function (DUF2946)
MIGLRGRSWRRLGASLSGLALGLQLILSSFGLALTAGTADPAETFGHALCLADGVTPPAGNAPASPVHSHFASCCLWHQIPGVEPVALSVPAPIAVAYVTAAERGVAAFAPGPQRGPRRARAPPILI